MYNYYKNKINWKMYGNPNKQLIKSVSYLYSKI